MYRALLAVTTALIAVCGPADAGDVHETLGFGRIFSNDALGDGQDRWKTGSYGVSWVRGPGWDGALPGRPGEVLEYRLRADLIAPSNLLNPAPTDRRYVGALSFGVHSHWQADGTEFAAGIGLLATGPQTGLGDLHRVMHEILGMSSPAPALVNQIPNAIYPQLSFEVGRPVPLSGQAALRPFFSVEAGPENLVRVGGEVTFGPVWEGALMLRDTTTGHRYSAVRGDGTGFGVVFGGDVAYVHSSEFLPATGGYQLTDVRARARAGLRWQGRKSSAFYGITWLGREFSAQPESQLVGSLSIDIRF